MAGRSLIAFALPVLAAGSAAATLLDFTYSIPLEQTREGRAPTRASSFPVSKPRSRTRAMRRAIPPSS